MLFSSMVFLWVFLPSVIPAAIPLRGNAGFFIRDFFFTGMAPFLARHPNYFACCWDFSLNVGMIESDGYGGFGDCGKVSRRSAEVSGGFLEGSARQPDDVSGILSGRQSIMERQAA